MANKSTNKVRVSRLFGTDATVGLIEPAVDMQVRRGVDDRWITALDTDHGQVTLASTSGGTNYTKAYPHELCCTTGVADYFGWPDATTSVEFGHSGVSSSGVEDLTKGWYNDGDGPIQSFTY